MSLSIRDLSIRQINMSISAVCVCLMLAAAYMEHVMQMVPCSLCITQRGFIVLTGIIALIAALHNPRHGGHRVYATMGIISAILGACFAGRQLWLQSLPADQVPACGPGLAYMFEAFPLLDAVKLLLQGDGNCAQVDKIFGLSIALWTFMAFIALGVVNLYQAVRKGAQNS